MQAQTLTMPLESIGSDAITSLDKLLRGEISAVETYDLALKQTRNFAIESDVSQLKSTHEAAVAVLRGFIIGNGGSPSETSGAWGLWVRMVEQVATMLGDSAALKTLKEGEEHGIQDYNRVLEEDTVPSRTKDSLRKIVMQSEKNIQCIDRLIARTNI